MRADPGKRDTPGPKPHENAAGSGSGTGSGTGSGRGAGVADALEFHARAGCGKAFDLKIRNIRHGHGRHDVAHPAAERAANVLMRAEIPVEPTDGACRLKLENFPIFRQKIKIAVNRAQADAGKSGAHQGVQFVRRGMRADLFELFKNDHTLPCHARLWM